MRGSGRFQTICRLPMLDGREDSLGDAQGLVDMLMEFLGPGVAADSQNPSIACWQAHGDDLMGGKLLSQGFPGGVNAPIQEGSLDAPNRW